MAPARRIVMVGVLSTCCAVACLDSNSRQEGQPRGVIYLEAEREFGELQGDSTLIFEQLVGAAVDKDGNVLIADAAAGQVRSFTIDGRFIRSVGRLGDGPGEFRRLRSIAVVGDTLIAYDAGLSRITLLHLNTGEVSHTFTVDNANGDAYLGNGVPIRVLGDSLIALGVGGASQRGSSERYDEARIYTLSGSLVGTTRIARAPLKSHTFKGFGGGDMALELPFTPWTVWTFDKNGDIAAAWGGEYRIVMLNFASDTIAVLTRETEPVDVSEQERVAARHWTDAMLSAFGAQARELEGYRLPEQQQQITGLSFAPGSEEMWISRTDFAPNPVFDVFVGNEFRCTVTLLAGGRMANGNTVPLIIDRQRMFLVAQDTIGAQYLLTYYPRTSSRLAACLAARN